MRSLRSMRYADLVSCVFALLFTATTLSAQSRNVGAPFLLLPVGAQSVGQGEAVVADTSLGTESMWWNAAGLARIRKREIGVFYSTTAAANSGMLVLAIPSKVLGTVAIAGYIVDLGDIEITGQNQEPLGTSTDRYYTLAASYASPIGKHLSAGITAKFVMLRFVCSCTIATPELSGNTSAFDVGGQYLLPGKLPVTLGLSVRNLGPALQVKDEEQADPLPRILQAGAHTTLPIESLAKNGLSIDAMSDVFASQAYAQPTLNLGVSLAYRRQLILRGGLRSSNGNPGSSASLTGGIGVRRGAVIFDVAREFDSASSALGAPPTYVSLRYLF